MAAAAILEKFQMAISPQRLTYLYSAHHAVIFAIAQLSCHNNCTQVHDYERRTGWNSSEQLRQTHVGRPSSDTMQTELWLHEWNLQGPSFSVADRIHTQNTQRRCGLPFSKLQNKVLPTWT